MNTQPTSETNARGVRAKTRGIVALGVVLLVFGGTLVLAMLSDVAPPDDTDLTAPPRATVTADANAFVAMANAVAGMTEWNHQIPRWLRDEHQRSLTADKDGGVFGWESSAWPERPELLRLSEEAFSANASVISKLGAAAELPAWRSPSSASTNPHVEARFILELWFWVAKWRQDYDEAARSTLTRLRLAQLNLRGAEGSGDYLVALASLLLGLEQTRLLLEQPSASEPAALAALVRFVQEPGCLACADRTTAFRRSQPTAAPTAQCPRTRFPRRHSSRPVRRQTAALLSGRAYRILGRG
ncbi:MAG: hypothetical protein AAF581_10595 [Planctomycetota bacterium]